MQQRVLGVNKVSRMSWKDQFMETELEEAGKGRRLWEPLQVLLGDEDDGLQCGAVRCWREEKWKDAMDSGGRDFPVAASGRWQWRGEGGCRVKRKGLWVAADP